MIATQLTVLLGRQMVRHDDAVEVVRLVLQAAREGSRAPGRTRPPAGTSGETPDHPTA